MANNIGNFFSHWESKLHSLQSIEDFKALTLEAYRFQCQHNEVYRQWCEKTSPHYLSIESIEDIPMLPISFFKTKRITCFPQTQPQDYFLSSATTGMQRSCHLIYDKQFYIRNTFDCFTQFFSKVEDYCYICLLPNYLQQQHSSLICMMDAFVRKSKAKGSGFFRDELSQVANILETNEQKGIKTILFGVTYALLDLMEYRPLNLRNTIVFETGGMKGRRQETTKARLHSLLCQGFGVEKIYSEYGMCELLSQAYSLGQGLFFTPKQMQILIKEVNDYKAPCPQGRSGVINIIDLANIHSCCFIQTEDLGKIIDHNTFEILGRLDHSSLRGCNLLH